MIFIFRLLFVLFVGFIIQTFILGLFKYTYGYIPTELMKNVPIMIPLVMFSIYLAGLILDKLTEE